MYQRKVEKTIVSKNLQFHDALVTHARVVFNKAKNKVSPPMINPCETEERRTAWTLNAPIMRVN